MDQLNNILPKSLEIKSKEAMDPSMPSIFEVHGMLLALQKNLECPICLEVMKEPVSTNCAHIFCRFCTLKLLKQKKGVAQCPLCNAKVTKRSLREDVRFKQVIKVVLETIHAFERDTGLKFSEEQCFSKQAIESASSTVPESEQLVVDSKGYRDRLKRVKAGKKAITNLQNEKARMSICDGTITRYSLRKKSSSSKTVVLEVGSDSSEDTFKKTDTDRKMGFRKSSLSQSRGENTKNQSTGPCLVNPPKPCTEDGTPLNIPGARCFLGDDSQSIEGAQNNPEHLKINKDNAAVERSQDLSFPHPGMEQLSKKPECSSLEEQGSYSILTMAQLCDDVAEPTTEKETRNGTDGANSMQPVGSAHILCEQKGQVLPSQTSPGNPLSPVTGKRLMQSIQKVSEWLSKSQEVLSPSSLQDVQTVEVNQDLNLVHLSGADCSSISQKMEPMEEQEEFIRWHEGDRSLFKPTVSKIEDKIFGRTYKRERKSAPFRNERERTYIQIGEDTAASTKSCEILMRKNKTRKRKATSELTPEDFMKESSKRLDRDGNPSLEVPDQAFTLADDRSPAEQNEVELPSELSVREGVSIVDTDVSEEPQGICHRWPESDLKNLNLKTRNSLGRRGKALSRSFGPLELIVDGNSTSPKTSKIQVDVEPSEVDTGQKKVRRSRRLQLLTEEDCCGDRELQLLSEGTGRRSEPAKRKRKQVSKKIMKERRSEAVIVPSLSVKEDEPPVLQSPCSGINPRDMKGKAGKTCAELTTSPCVAGTSEYMSVEQTPKDHSPCCSVHHAHIQSSCSPLQSLPMVAKQTTAEDKELKIHHPAKGAQGLEGDGSSTEEVTGSCKPSATADNIAAPLELNPETDDSEVDTGFMQKIFSCCKRQSFLLSTTPVKESAVEIQRKLSTGQVEGNEIHHVNKCTQNDENKTVSFEGNRDFSVERLASSASGFPQHESKTEHLQLASQTPFQDCLSVPLLPVAKSIKGRNHSPSQKLTTDKITSPEIETAGPNGSSDNRSPRIWRNGSFYGSSLRCVNESSSSVEHLPDAGSVDAESFQPELIQPHPAICEPPLSPFSCALPEKHGNSMEQKQLSCNLVEATDISSPDIPKCFVSKENLEQGSQEDSRGFELSVETPDGLLGSANEKEGSSKHCAIDRSDVLALSAKTDKQLSLGGDLRNSVQRSSKLKNQGPSMAQRRQVRKLPSSEEEDSSEDEELPCFQELFGMASQSLQEKETAAEMPTPKSTSQSNRLEKDDDACPSQESEGSVNLFSSQSVASGDSDNNSYVSKQLTPVPSSGGVLASLGGNKEAMKPSSKASKDTEQLKDGQQECVNRESDLDEETLGYDSEASHLGDSLGLSSQSEIFTTQQRNAMQSNLKKLQQEMVDIEEALRQGSQHDAPKEWPLPNEEDDYTKELTSSGKGNKVKLTPESKHGFLVDFSITVKSSCCTPDNNSTSSSKSKKQICSGLTTKPARGSPGATPGTDRRSGALRHEIEGKLVSPFTTAACHNAKKRSPKTLFLTGKRNISLVASGLNQEELRAVQRFAKKTESTWSNKITEDTTHVVMKTDEDLVCERTLKYFLGIAGQKWVVSYQWIEHSLKAGSVLNEEDFEVRGDVINGRSHQGPKRARESPTGKLFHSLEICCYGPFTDMLPEQLEWMIKMCGATLVKQPHLFSPPTNAAAVVVVQPDAWVEDAACPEFPLHCSAMVVSREWVLDSVASYQRQPFDDYIVQQL